jgi:hypothetical protein
MSFTNDRRCVALKTGEKNPKARWKGWGYSKFCHSIKEGREWLSEELRQGKIIF